MAATMTAVELQAPGDDWIGAADQFEDKYVLTFAGDEVTAIEGTMPEIRAFVMRALAAITDHTPHSHEPSHQPGRRRHGGGACAGR